MSSYYCIIHPSCHILQHITHKAFHTLHTAAYHTHHTLHTAAYHTHHTLHTAEYYSLNVFILQNITHSTSLLSLSPSLNSSSDVVSVASGQKQHNIVSVITMDGPIPLIENQENGNLVVNPKAIEILSGFNTQVVVVSIVGLYRTGKSYLMNKLAGAQKGFSLGGKVEAETKGIWMWCVPHPKKENHTLVLLDTEGLGDVKKGDNKNDRWIFTLAVLLSSTMVYNSKGTIDQDALDKLKFVGELAELIKVKAKENDDEEAEFSRHFPSFVWAVRDFHLSLESEGQKITSDEYLEKSLALKKASLKNMEYNTIRSCITMFFGNRKCFVFDMPTIDKDVLQTLEDVPENMLNPNFTTQCKEFCEYIWNTADVKKVDDIIKVTGSRLGKLATFYTEAVNTSNFACMETAVVSLAEMENKMAVQEATQCYEDKMKEIVLPTKTLEDFMTQSSRCEDEARQIFKKRSFNYKDQQFLQEYLENIQKKKKEFTAMNEEKSREVCRALIKKLSADFEKALKEKAYHKQGGHGKFKEDLNAIKNKYDNESGKGVMAEEILQEFMKSQQSSEITIIQEDNALNQKQKEEEEENARKKIVAMEEELKKLQETQKEKKVEDEKDNLKKTFSEILERMEEDRRIINDKLEQALRQKEQNHQLYTGKGLEDYANIYQEQIKQIRQEKKENEETGPAWYEPIAETFRSVAVTVVPELLKAGQTWVKETFAKRSAGGGVKSVPKPTSVKN